MTVATSFWSEVLPAVPNVEWRERMRTLAEQAEQRRSRADYNTGSILEIEAYALVALAEYLLARVVIEVGTFIGMSTTALASAATVEAVYTCDASNACLPSAGKIHAYPKRSSTQMLSDLVRRGVQADVCFLDGVLAPDDTALTRVCRPDTVFALHDYNYGPKLRRGVIVTAPQKGIGNAKWLQRYWPTHVVVDPMPDTTLALMVPESRL